MSGLAGWQADRPESLQAYLPDGVKVIDHDRRVYAAAVSPNLQLGEMDGDPRVQIYRTSLDMFLSWLALVASALDRKLFLVADIHDVGYWVAKIESEVVIHPFIAGYGYASSLQKLVRLYRHKESDHQNWVFPSSRVTILSNSVTVDILAVMRIRPSLLTPTRFG